MQAKHKDDYEEIRPDKIESPIHENETTDSPNALASLSITKAQPHYQTIVDLVQKTASEMAAEPLLLDGRVHLLDDWARVDGQLRTKSGKLPINVDAWLFELDFTEAFRLKMEIG